MIFIFPQHYHNTFLIDKHEDSPLLDSSHGSRKLGAFKDNPGMENKAFTSSPIAIVKVV